MGSEEDLQQEPIQEEEQELEQQQEQVQGREQELLRQIEELTRQSEENNHRFLRAHADLENYRRRAAKEKEDILKYASSRIVEALLPVLDNFERAIHAGKENSGDNDPMVQGVEMVFRQIQQILELENVRPIEAVGKPFDPNYHQAVMQVESEEYEPGIVVEELQKGYMLNDRVIRPSMVKVSS